MLVAVMLTIFSVSAFAGTTDTLGMSGSWAKVEAILTDKYLQPIIVTAIFATAVFRWFKEHPWQAVSFLVLSVFIGQITTISQAIAGAMV
jgi:hypothetical protein